MYFGFLGFLINDIEDKLQGKYWGRIYNEMGKVICINIDDKLQGLNIK